MQNADGTPKPTPKPKLTTVQMIAMTALVLINIAVFVAVAWMFHDTCGNGWFVAILKSIGLQCLATCIMALVSSLFWLISSKPTRKIAAVINPSSVSGSMLTQFAVIGLYVVFSRNCVTEQWN